MAQEIMMIEMVVDTALFEQRTEAVKTETRGVDGELMDRIKGAQIFSVAYTLAAADVYFFMIQEKSHNNITTDEVCVEQNRCRTPGHLRHHFIPETLARCYGCSRLSDANQVANLAKKCQELSTGH